MHGFGHAVEDHDALTRASGGKRFDRRAYAAVNVLPVVGDPHVASWINVNINLHLQASADVAEGRRNGIARFHAWRTVLGANSTQVRELSRRAGKIRDPNVVVAIHCRCPRTWETAASKWTARKLAAVRFQHNYAATLFAAFLFRQNFRQIVRSLLETFGLEPYTHVHQMGHAE